MTLSRCNVYDMNHYTDCVIVDEADFSYSHIPHFVTFAFIFSHTHNHARGDEYENKNRYILSLLLLLSLNLIYHGLPFRYFL